MVRLVLPLLLSLVTCCSGWYLSSTGSCPLARHARQSRQAAVTMKGRSQGGGPKISTKDKKKKHKPAALARLGSPAPAKEPVKKTPRAAGSEAPLSIKRQWDRHKEHVRNGVEPWTVFACARGTEDWLEVGSVTVDPGASETTPEQAVQLHKRLILSHSLRLHPTLSPFRNELDCGFTPPASEDKDQENSEPVLLNAVEPGLPALCGFAGKPDESSGHYFVENEPLPEQGGKKVIRDKLGNDSKSKVAEAFSKQLGLRSG